MHPSTVRTQLLGLRRLSLPMQQPRRRGSSTTRPASFERPLDGAAALRAPGVVLNGEIDGTPARVFDLTSRSARIELSYPVDLSQGTLRIEVDGAHYELAAHVRWYRRHPDGPAAYGVEFSAPPVVAEVA